MDKTKEKYILALRPMMEESADKLTPFLTAKLNKIMKYLLMQAESVRQKKVDDTDYVPKLKSENPMDFFDIRLFPLLETVKHGMNYAKTTQLGLPKTNNLGPNFSVDMKVGKILELIRQREKKVNPLIAQATLDRTNEILAGVLLAGESFQDLALRWRSAFGGTVARSKKIAETESNWAFNAGIIQYGKDVGVQRVGIKTAIGACPVCLEAAKYTYSIKDVGIDGLGLLPIHPNCRCIIILIAPRNFKNNVTGLKRAFAINQFGKYLTDYAKEVAAEEIY